MAQGRNLTHAHLDCIIIKYLNHMNHGLEFGSIQVLNHTHISSSMPLDFVGESRSIVVGLMSSGKGLSYENTK